MNTAAISELIDSLVAFEDNINNAMREIINANEAYICDMNSHDQLFELGVNSDGDEIASYAPYTETTAHIKRMKGQPTSRVTLKDEGDFHRSFYIEHTPSGFYITSNDSKAEHLADKYSSNVERDNIFGLTEANVDILSEDFIKPALIELLRSALT